MAITKINYSFSNEERNTLEKVISESNNNPKFILRANILYAFSLSENGEIDVDEIATQFNTSLTTVYKVRSELMGKGFHDTLFPTMRYKYTLSEEEYSQLQQVFNQSREGSKLKLRAAVLLKLYESNQNYLTSEEIAQCCNTSPTTVKKVRAQLAQEGLEATLYPQQRETPPVTPVTKGIEQQILSLAASEPPHGHKKWSVRLLAQQCVELGYIDSISHCTIARFLKKNNITL